MRTRKPKKRISPYKRKRKTATQRKARNKNRALNKRYKRAVKRTNRVLNLWK